ncbi:hypothetical protein JMJ35_009000 [Cladonia borealis]|uniref:Uncharacterized protein n=1 Tax=Cladonia borealis TaxID=184061 RepID=A0AA39V2J2_9LECA|nr:hypothetical protein JMJ35_009000 [Cladonia borealis]
MGVEYGPPDIDLLSFVFQNGGGGQDKPVLIDASDASRYVTPRSARKITRQLIAGLRAEGLRPGDCVCIHSFNDIYYPMIYMAIIGTGARFTGSNPGYTSLELNHHVHTSGAKYIISEPHMLSTVQATAKECNIPDERIFVFDAHDKTPYDQFPHRSWESLLQHGEEDWVKFRDPYRDMRNTIATLAFTSGTTGLPKAAMISHHYSVAQIHAIRSQGKPYPVNRLICLPAFHNFALPMITGCAIREQQSVYIMRRFELKLYLDSIKNYDITESPMVPAMIIAILNSPLTRREDLQSLRYIWCGGSPLRSCTQAEFQALLSAEARVTQVWGMTETGWCIVFFWPEGDDTGSIGRILPGMSMRLKDIEGNLIEEDEVHGEMYIKGPCMMSGYLDNPTATAAAMDKDGWLRTGDIAYTIKGKVYIVDRAKDLIKVRGWQVAPAELEAILITHPSIINAAVIGIPVPEGTGEVPRAYVQLKPKPSPEHETTTYGVADEKEVTEEDVKQWVRERLARYKWLDGGVRFVDNIPRNAGGKVQKVKLRAMEKELEGAKGENLKGKKAQDPMATDYVDGQRTEGEMFNERMTIATGVNGPRANGV